MQSLAESIAENCRRGLGDLGAGHLDRAQARFAEIVKQCPDFPPALHALGVIARQEGRWAEALGFAARALKHTGGATQAQILMARVLADMGRLAEASHCYRQALARPDVDPQTHLELAAIAERLDDEDAAIEQYQAALAVLPAELAARRPLVALFRRHGRLAEAEQLCHNRLTQAPNDAEAWFDLGNILYDAEHFEPAAKAFRTVLQFQPDHADATENLGHTLQELGDLAAAETYLRHARTLRPQLPGPHNGLGAVLRQTGQIEAAEACFRTALALAPGHVEASCNLATTLLLTGRMEEGWRHYEARWGTTKLPNRGFIQPMWQGEPLGERTLLLHGEQGLGDTLQFCRFIRRVKAARMLLEVPASLVRLMRQSFPELADVVAYGETLPAFDVHCPLMSLPLVLGIPVTAFSDAPRYLTADPDERAMWRARLDALPGRRFGLVWQGNPRIASMRRRRDLPSHHLASLAPVPGIHWISLQKQPPPEETPVPMTDWTAELSDFAATAALVAELDLVIGVDTSVVHLAGALGRPVWLLNRFDTCWRWMTDRTDSPWYPTLHQLRQKTLGDWESVVQELVERLELLQNTMA
jgi:Flp pilus assembly protein TadD